MFKKYTVLDCQIIRFSMDEMLACVNERRISGEGGYVCFTNVHVAVTARKNPALKRTVNNSFMSVPDGKPIYWIGKLNRYENVEHIPGPDFFEKLLSNTASTSHRHFFYGATQEVLNTLLESVKRKHPGINIVGTESPPFRELSSEEVRASLKRINNAKPDYIWVGLGAPKQELWMSSYWRELKPAILFGVGAAFDFHAGTTKRAPAWMRRRGLEWLYRLKQEPRRLWKRYFYTNIMFVVLLIKDVFSK